MTARERVKAAARTLARIVVAPVVASFAVRARLLGRDRALLATSQWLALIPGLPGRYLRCAFLQHALAECHHTVVVEWGTTISRAGTRLREHVYVGPGCHLGLTCIERDALIGAGVHIPSGGATHGFDDPDRPIREQARTERAVRIGAGAWIGSTAIVLSDVGEGTVVGAGAVVSRALPPRVVAAGTPARVLRARPERRTPMRVLMLTHRLPFAPNRGDRIRAYHIIRELARNADVRVVSLAHDRDEEAQVPALEAIGVRAWTARVTRVRNFMHAIAALPFDTPLTHVLLRAPSLPRAIEGAIDGWPPDVVLCYGSGIAPAVLQPPLDRVPLVVDFVDVDSAKWAALADSSGRLRAWIFRREARCLARFEAALARRAHRSVVVNEREEEALRRVCANAGVDAAVDAVPNGIDIASFKALEAPAAGRDVVFTGVFNYGPNVEAALWLAREVWPRVRAEVSDARLRLVGAHPLRAIRRLAANDPTIIVTGGVPDVRPYLWSSAVAVAPLFSAFGVQNKVLEAVAASLPVVVTPGVWDGLPRVVHPACRCATDSEPFARAIIDLLLAPPAARRRAAARAGIDQLAWSEQLAPLIAMVGRAAGLSSRGASVSPATSRSQSPQGSSDPLPVPSP